MGDNEIHFHKSTVWMLVHCTLNKTFEAYQTFCKIVPNMIHVDLLTFFPFTTYRYFIRQSQAIQQVRNENLDIPGNKEGKER